MKELSPVNRKELTSVRLSQAQEVAIPKPFQQDILLFETHVAGTSHIEGIEELEPFIQIGDRLDFFREVTNSYDQNAIEIRNASGVKLGFLPQKDNIVFSRLMDAGKLLYGKIQSKELRGRWLKIQIEIYLQDL
ncbi:HIRAN domain-containing protein [Streptococcus sp. DD13]|uniref:HIRAN domain-containing protein n=1 Tax=Streptococcus sp. DD13 TaxID=1777881 RepID=UPI000791EFEC|nr:HIRAN domain-containing protein [Streptococcus sp. DD13]KXT79082.1 hypothetical protein STRDD13_00201 [Streptococcus sp. DD13]